MVWSAKGDERVKSYKLYRDLEESYSAAIRDIDRLQLAIRQKDELIRRLAIEVANLGRPEPEESDEDIVSFTREMQPTTPRTATLPAKLQETESSVDITESGTITGRVNMPRDPLGHVLTKQKLPKRGPGVVKAG